MHDDIASKYLADRRHTCYNEKLFEILQNLELKNLVSNFFFQIFVRLKILYES